MTIQVLTGEEIREWWASENGMESLDMCNKDDFRRVVRTIESALLAKLAAVELPEPVVIDRHIPSNVVIRGYTADQLRLAHAQGAAAMLSSEPVMAYKNDGFSVIYAPKGHADQLPVGEFDLHTLKDFK